MLKQARKLRTVEVPEPTPFDRYIWSLRDQKLSDEEIMVRANLDDKADIDAAVTAVELWMSATSRPMVVAKMQQAAMEAAGGIGKVLVDAQQAETLIHPGRPETVLKTIDPETKKETVEVIPETPPMFGPDHVMRLEAVKMTNEVVKAVAAAAPQVQINQQKNVFNPGAGPGGTNGRSFEARVRLRRDQLGLDKPSRQLTAAPDDEVIDGDVMEPDEDGSDGRDISTADELADEQVDDLVSP